MQRCNPANIAMCVRHVPQNTATSACLPSTRTPALSSTRTPDPPRCLFPRPQAIGTGTCLSDKAVADGTFDLDKCPSLLGMLVSASQLICGCDGEAWVVARVGKEVRWPGSPPKAPIVAA